MSVEFRPWDGHVGCMWCRLPATTEVSHSEGAKKVSCATCDSEECVAQSVATVERWSLS